MFRILLLLFIIGATLTSSCRLPHEKELICEGNLKKVRALILRADNNRSTLDSALSIVNRSMQCDSIKAAIIDIKIRLMITLNQLKEGVKFIDSLPISDFSYTYKKALYRNNFVALNLASLNDTSGSNDVYQKMINDLTAYVNYNDLKQTERREVFFDLYSLKSRFYDSVQLNRELDSLRARYNDQFFDGLKQ